MTRYQSEAKKAILDFLGARSVRANDPSQRWCNYVVISVELNIHLAIVSQYLKELKGEGLIEENRSDMWRLVKIEEQDEFSGVKTEKEKLSLVTRNNGAIKEEIYGKDNEVRNNLSQEEQQLLVRLEQDIRQAFYVAGAALLEIRDRRLYRQDFFSFEEYCQSRFTLTRRSVDYLIVASSVVNNLLRTKENNQVRTNGSQVLSFVLPTSERQVRPLAKLEPEKQVEVWHKAVEIAGGKVPSGKIVKNLVDQIKSTQSSSDNVEAMGEVVDRPVGKKKTKKRSEFQDGIVYSAGEGVRWRIHLSEENGKKLDELREETGAVTMEGAIIRLLEEYKQMKRELY